MTDPNIPKVQSHLQPSNTDTQTIFFLFSFFFEHELQLTSGKCVSGKIHNIVNGEKWEKIGRKCEKLMKTFFAREVLDACAFSGRAS